MNQLPSSPNVAGNLLPVEKTEEGQRIERFLKRALPATPHNLLHKWLRSGQVRLNGARVKASAKLQGGDSVRLPPFCNLKQAKSVATAQYSPARERVKIENLIVQNTADYMILAKPAGMACQGGSGVYRSLDYMLTNAATENKRASEQTEQSHELRPKLSLGAPRLVHRLDQPTSGLLLVAKHRAAAADLAKLFKLGLVRKIYCAILTKTPKEKQAKYTSSLSKGSAGEKQSAETQLVVLDRCGLALVLLRPVSGRKHQLRRHMADAGTAILGETIYNSRTETREQRKKQPLRLHAMSLQINAKEIEARGLEKKYQRYELKAHLPPPKDFLKDCKENFLDASSLEDPYLNPFLDPFLDPLPKR